MRKAKLFGVVGCLLLMSACGKKEVTPATTTTAALTTAEETTEAEAETEDIGYDNDDGFTYDFVEEDYDIEAEFEEGGEKDIPKMDIAALNKVDTEVGYSFYSIRKMDHDRSLEQFNDIPTIQDILSGEYWTGDQVVHQHQSSGLDEEPGYYHEEDCWIEEQVNVQHYPKDGLSEGWVYDDGETFADWLNQNAMDSAWGEGSRIIHYTYNVDGAKWNVFYAQRNMDEAPKDVFSPIECTAYHEEENGDYVVVTLKHNNLPTISTDAHVPLHEERMATAQEALEVIVSTIQKN